MKKFVSIITPTFNEEKNIKSLCNAISDEMKKLPYDYEHIVIDNSSSDKTVEVLREISLKIIRLKL